MFDWVSFGEAVIAGGVAGSLISIGYSWWSAKIDRERKEEGGIAALLGELRRTEGLCEFNVRLWKSMGALPPYIRFPSTVALKIAFEERHEYPQLAPIQDLLELYVLAVLHVNQMIDLCLAMPIEIPRSATPGNLRASVGRICDRQQEVDGFGEGLKVSLPGMARALIVGVGGIKVGKAKKRNPAGGTA